MEVFALVEVLEINSRSVWPTFPAQNKRRWLFLHCHTRIKHGRSKLGSRETIFLTFWFH